mgnify:CR=1 FL=1
MMSQAFDDQLMWNGLIVFLVVCFPVPGIFWITSQKHLQTLHTEVKALTWYACKSVIDKVPVDILTYDTYDSMMQDTPRIIVLTCYLSGLTAVIIHLHHGILHRWKIQLQNHPPQLLQILFCMLVMPPRLLL